MEDYLIFITTTARVVVQGAGSKDEAVEQAIEALNLGDTELDEAICDQVIKEKDLDLEIRCAQKHLKDGKTVRKCSVPL